MRKILLLLTLILLTISGLKAQTKIFFDFLSHNEETNQWNGTPFYTANRTKIISLSNYFQNKGITWNMQSDWVYLSNVLSQETVALMATTNNKNILRWMYEDKGVEMDPHAHESQYIYPDVVKLMDSIGLPESKVIGGSIYNDYNGMNLWTNMQNGQNGVVFPSKFWRPDYLMGGGTPNHVADLKYYGFWNPKDTANYLVHDTTKHIRHIGVGCEMKIRDTTTVSIFVAGLRDLINKVQTGQYPPNEVYLQTVFFEQADLNNISFYNKVIEIADSMHAMVTAGEAEWGTLKQTYTYWETVQLAEMFQWECGQVATGINDLNAKTQSLVVYPNPVGSGLTLESSELFTGNDVGIFDFMGTVVIKKPTVAGMNKMEINVSGLPPGVYLLRSGTATSTWIKE